MTTRLTLDTLRLVTEETLADDRFETGLNISLVCQATYNIIYPMLLKSNGVSVTEHSRTNQFTPRSLEFFLRSDNPTLVERFMKCFNLGPNAICHDTPPYCGSILNHAIRTGASTVVESLLQAGASAIKYNCLSIAIDKGSAIILSSLLEHRRIQSNAETSGDAQQDELLLCYIKNICFKPKDYPNAQETLNTLLRYYPNVNEGRYPVIHQVICTRNPCHDNYQRAIMSLIEGGVDVDALSPSWKYQGRWVRGTVLNWACVKGNPELIRALLKAGASTQGASASDFSQNQSPVPVAPTPLFDLLHRLHKLWQNSIYRGEAYFLGDRIENYYWSLKWNSQKKDIYASAELLIRHGLAGPQGILDENQNVLLPISTVCAQLNIDWGELFTLLVEGGVLDVHWRNEFGQTLLNQIASRCCGNKFIIEPSWKPNLIRSLLEGGADPNTVDDSGMTPLHYGILFGDLDLVKLLVESGADPAKEIDGSTPTHYAFGKPFPRRRPVMGRVMSSLEKQLKKLIRRKQASIHIKSFAHYDTYGWHPILSVCSNPFMREEYKMLVKDAERRMFSIMAFLSPFAETAKDEHGNTPRDIAEKTIGLLKKGESLVLRPKALHMHKRSYSEHQVDIKRCSGRCEVDCPFCFSFPRQLLDVTTGKLRPTVSTCIEITTENGRVVRTPAEMTL